MSAVPKEDVNSWQETIYLLRSPGNARRLAGSITEAEAGRTEPHELVEIDDAE